MLALANVSCQQNTINAANGIFSSSQRWQTNFVFEGEIAWGVNCLDCIMSAESAQYRALHLFFSTHIFFTLHFYLSGCP